MPVSRAVLFLLCGLSPAMISGSGIAEPSLACAQHQGLSFHRTGIVAAGLSAFSCTADVPADHSPCVCPRSQGWDVYPDSSRGNPAFLSERGVSLEKVAVCTHALSLYFRSRQEGETRETCLVFERPQFQEYLSTEGDSLMLTEEDENRLSDAESSYENLLSGVRYALSRPCDPGVIEEFSSRWLFHRRPRIDLSNSPDILLRYDGRETPLSGPSLNVYFRGRERDEYQSGSLLGIGNSESGGLP